MISEHACSRLVAASVVGLIVWAAPSLLLASPVTEALMGPLDDATGVTTEAFPEADAVVLLDEGHLRFVDPSARVRAAS